MINNLKKLRYLTLFYKDLEQITEYISNNLCNPKAASDLVNNVEKAIIERLSSAESFETYQSKKERKYPYYRIYVGNYIVYYVVIDDECDDKTMEVRRILYNKRNQKDLI